MDRERKRERGRGEEGAIKGKLTLDTRFFSQASTGICQLH